MRIRVRHIALLVITLITLFMFYAITVREANAPPVENAEGLALPMDVPIEKAPEIVLDTTHLDLGVIPNDKETRKEIPVYNRGGSVLEIHDVLSSCKLCTLGYFEPGKNRIAPGESSLMTVAVSPAGIHGFHSQKTLTLSSNDPRNSQIMLTVEARVDPEYVLEPAAFDFGEVAKGTTQQSSVVLRNLTDTPVAVLSASLAPDETEQKEADTIRLSVEPVEENAWKQPGKKEYRITATLSPEMPGSHFEIPVFIRTDLKRFSPERILATGKIIAPYTLVFNQPSNELHLRGDAPATIIVRGDAPLNIHNIRSEQGFFVVQLQSENNSLYHIECSAEATLERGMYKDNLLFDVVVESVTYGERIPVTVYAYGNAPDKQ